MKTFSPVSQVVFEIFLSHQSKSPFSTERVSQATFSADYYVKLAISTQFLSKHFSPI